MRKLFLTLSALFFLLVTAFSQNRVITGRITDDQGTPLSNVSVTVKNSSVGTTTDADGSFRLSVPATARALVFSSVGFELREVAIGNQREISISLRASERSMEEVVIVAYGTQKKESVTGSIATIGAKDLEKRLVSNVTQALAGAAPGIQAISGNGQPGNSTDIRIRGFGSINHGASPLFVVDGFPYEGSLGDINPNDIENISLLKDASSTALFGARAANGVVMITMKKGKSGTPKVNISVTTGQSQRSIPEYDRVGTNDYYPLIWQAIKNSLMYPATGTGISESAAAAQASANVGVQLVYNPYNVPRSSIVGLDGKLNPNAVLVYDDFDWYDGVTQQGDRKEISLSTSGKVDKNDYLLSFNYTDDEGFIIKSGFERVTGRINFNSQVKSWLRTGINLSGVLVKQDRTNALNANSANFFNPFQFARGIGPIYPVHAYATPVGPDFIGLGTPVLDANGVHVFDYGSHTGAVNRPSGASPGRHILYETLLNSSKLTRNSMIARTYLETKLGKYFTFTANVGLDLTNTRTQTIQNRIVGDGATAGGTSTRVSNLTRSISANQLLNYTKKFGSRHDLSVLVGHESQWLDMEFFNGNRRALNLEGNVELINYTTVGDVTGNIDKVRRDAYLSRVNYGLDKKYFIEASYRRDASSRFHPDVRWGNFYSVGASWFVKRESFLNDLGWLSELKLRAGYGTVGNEVLLNADGTERLYGYQAFYELAWNNGPEPGAIAGTLANPNLTWETNTALSLGIDFGMFKNRLSGTIEYFDRGSTGLLFSVPQGQSSIVTTRIENIGAMSNRGVELQLQGDIIRTKDVNWELQVMATKLKNKVTKLPNGTPIIQETKRLSEGTDLFNFWLRDWYGVDPNDGAGLYYALPGLTTGYRISKGGDTVVTNPTNARFVYSGSSIPDLFGSLSSTISVKGISLSVLVNYQIGGKFYDANYASLMRPSYGGALHVDVLRSWQKPGDITDIPRLDISSTGNINAASNRFLIDASYLQFRNVSLSYSLGAKNLFNGIKFDQIRFHVTGENLGIVAKRKGLNPAENFDGVNRNIFTPNRFISAGINVTF